MKNLFLCFAMFIAMVLMTACGSDNDSTESEGNTQEECTSGEFKCEGSESYYCNSQGSWVYDARCEKGCDSSTGKCYSDSGDSSDSGNNNDNGDSSDSGNGNDDTDSGDSSADLKCTDEGSFRCYDDKIRQKCVSGTWTNFEDCEYVCNSTTQQCEDEKGCKSGEYKCIGKNSHYCSNDFWELNEKCTYDCDYNTGKCKDSECTTGEYLCGESTDSEYKYASYYCKNGYWTYNKTCYENCDKSTGQCKPCPNTHVCKDSKEYRCENGSLSYVRSCAGDCNKSTGLCEETCVQAAGKTWTEETSSMTWQGAKDYCNDHTECGYSDWRLPTISELRSLIQNCPATQTGGECGVTDSCLSLSDCWNDACSGCDYDSSGKYSKLGDPSWLWSSSVRSDNSDKAWIVDFGYGSVVYSNKSNNHYVRCVR